MAASAENELAKLDVNIEFVGVSRAGALAAKTAAWFAGNSRSFASRESQVDVEQWLANSASGLRVLVRETTPGQLRLWFLLQSSGSRKHLIREQALPTGLDEIGLENVAQLIFSSALALIEGREETTVAPSEPEAPPPERSVSVRDSSVRARRLPAPSNGVEAGVEAKQHAGLQLSAAAGYELRASGPEGIFQGPLLALGVRQRAPGWNRALTAAVTLLAPSSFEDTDFAVRTKGYSARLEALATRAGTDPLLPEVSFGLGVDWLSLSPESLSSQRFTASVERTSVRPFLAIGAGVSFRTGALRLSTQLEGVVHLSRAHYDVDEGGVRREALGAWPLQPALRVALRW